MWPWMLYISWHASQLAALWKHVRSGMNNESELHPLWLGETCRYGRLLYSYRHNGNIESDVLRLVSAHGGRRCILMCIHIAYYIVFLQNIVGCWAFFHHCLARFFIELSRIQTNLIIVSLEDLIIKNCELYINGLVQDYSNPSALAMELLQSCT